MRSLYPDWEGLARAVVSYIRMEAARKPDDPRLAELVGDLSIKDAQFRQWWAGTHVAVKRRGTRTYNHPVVGEITLDWDALTSDAEPDQQLIVYTRHLAPAPTKLFASSRRGLRSTSERLTDTALLAESGLVRASREAGAPSNNRKLAGVCGGPAQYFNTDATLIRVLFVMLALLGVPAC